MGNYSAGNLRLDVLGYSNSAVTSIKDTAKALNSLSNSIKKINNTRTVMAGQQLEHIFSKIATATNSINRENILALSSTAKSLSAISRLGKLENIDYSKVSSGFNSLTTAITPFLDRVQLAEKSLTSLYGILSRAGGKQIHNILNGNVGTSQSKGGSFGLYNILKWGRVYYIARRLGTVVSRIAQEGANYTETLNLWETSMGTNVTLATEFVNKMNDAYGISERTLMNAQATFKNMLGGLGNISDQMAYKLSEGVTQMAVDYASLYNQTFEQAFSKFQAALAGQVRPIRSVSGFDITENTIFQLYQQLGGTKTMRQLNRTEKQLLALLAIFRQMNATGATGDLRDTMESYANQSRVMAESWKQMLAYVGAITTHYIQQSGFLTQLNAHLIFLGDVFKAVAEDLDAIQHFADPFGNITDGANEAEDAMNGLNGKLLDFDKFNALNQSQDQNVFGLDERLIEAFSNFDSILANATMEARELAEELKIASGLFNEDGTFNKEKWDEIIDGIATFGRLLISLSTSGAILKIVRGLTAITIAGKGLNSILIGSVIWAIWEMIEAFKDGEYEAGILAGTLGVILLGAWALLNAEMLKTIGLGIGKFFSKLGAILFADLTPKLTIATGAMTKMTLVTSALSAGLGFLLGYSILNSVGEEFKTMAGGIMVAVGALTAFVAAMALALQWISLGTATPLIMGGLGLMTSGALAFVDYKDGGLPDKGTVFRAGEAGAEIVYNTPSGQSGVANIKQIEQAMYGALVRYGNNNGGADQHTVVKIGEDEVFNAVTKSAKRRGLSFTKV